MKQIHLTKGKFAIVDDDDFLQLSNLSWFFQSKGYAANKNGLMHRIILNANKLEQVDHINGDKLDNRKVNLRICTNSQNHMNKAKTSIKKSSKYKGVYWSCERERWRSDIKINKKKIHVGSFLDEDIAAKAYNEAALKYHGKFACLNIVGSFV